MKTIKIIDLLNKIAKGEEVPKKIKCDGVIYNYEFKHTIIGSYEYRSQNGNCLMNNMAGYLYLTDILNYEVEIIEEDKDIDVLELQENISKLQSEIDLLSNEIGSYHNKIHSMRDRNTYMKETLKDLQKTVNELKGKYE